MQKTLGGERLGSGSKMKVNLHGYERSTHDLSYTWRSTMAAGTLVPFMSEVALPGDTFDIDLACEILTHPTIGPLFGTYKVQLDLFQAPIRLYHAMLHNNALGIGLKMDQIKLPILQFTVPVTTITANTDIDNMQINPSCIMNYLGLKGLGNNRTGAAVTRDFNAIPFLAYWDIYKNYYANKQEEIGAVIHTPQGTLVTSTTQIQIIKTDGTTITVPGSQAGTVAQIVVTLPSDKIKLTYTGTAPVTSQIFLNTNEVGKKSLNELFQYYVNTDATHLEGNFNPTRYGAVTIRTWEHKKTTDLHQGKPGISTFPLDDIDKMRGNILSHYTEGTPFNVGTADGLQPYTWIVETNNTIPNLLGTQEGLGLKTYQSDLFQNWIQTEWIDGPNGINEITAVSTLGDKLYLDTLMLSKKVYDLLNRVAISGGTYDDWLDAVYDHDRYTRCETPMYMGGLIRELAFQEVVSNSESVDQQLGTLAGKGVMTQKKKGGHSIIKVDEPSYIIGIISLTPRLDYSQGNKWDVNLKSLDDLHKPGLDEIGFQELITEQMAWWDTWYSGAGTGWTTKSAGKQPAWLNYMTNVNQVKGNFAIKDNEMFMTLNRRYEEAAGGIKDLTTYIDPSKFNWIFAETSLDGQNFWAQISVNITARRKMSAKVMPNL